MYLGSREKMGGMLKCGLQGIFQPKQCIKLCAVHPNCIFGSHSAQNFFEQPQSPQNPTISRMNMQVIGQ